MEDFFNENNFQESETLLFMKIMRDKLLISIEKLEKGDRLLINKKKWKRKKLPSEKLGKDIKNLLFFYLFFFVLLSYRLYHYMHLNKIIQINFNM